MTRKFFTDDPKLVALVEKHKQFFDCDDDIYHDMYDTLQFVNVGLGEMLGIPKTAITNASQEFENLLTAEIELKEKTN